MLAVLVLLGLSSAIDPWIVNKVDTEGKADFLVQLKAQGDLSGAKAIKGKTNKAQFVYDTLTAVADATQGPIIELLTARGISYKAFWISNIILVENGDIALAEALAERDDVDLVFGNYEQELHIPVERGEEQEKAERLVEWNIDQILATYAWEEGINGTGIIVSNIDTGARWTHEALRPTYGGDLGAIVDHNYNWWDPRGTSAVPSDTNGHGSHTIGTVAGSFDSGIGVAPGARWVAARGCASSSCATADLISSFQFVTCPTRVDGSAPDCSRAPHVVNNSWGGGQGSTTFHAVIDAARAAGVVVIFSQGNSGSGCATANSPGDYLYVIGVGSTTQTDSLSSFSSRGQGSFANARQKPDVSAPGSNVRSATGSSDTSYASYSGTSMASPHISGVVALILQANSNLGVEDVEAILRQATDTDLPAPTGGLETCNNVHYSAQPNFHYGFGRINAVKAVEFADRKSVV